MIVLVEMEVTGEWEEPLSNDSIIDILDAVICDGARSVGMDVSFKVIKAFKEDV